MAALHLAVGDERDSRRAVLLLDSVSSLVPDYCSLEVR